MNKILAKMGAFFGAQVEKPAVNRQRFLAETCWEFECFDKNGKLKWAEKVKNVCTAEGLNKLLDVMFHGTTQIGTWYVLIFESDTTPSDTTTYTTPVFTESSAYDEATRPAFVEAAASGKSITNSANRAVFTISDTKTIYGAALVGGGTDPTVKGNTAGGGTLYAAAKFSSSKAVVDDDVLRVTVTITAADV